MADPGKKERAIIALIEEPTIREAAKVAGVGQTTLYRWLREDENFQNDYREARRQVVQKAIGALQRATGDAVKTLQDVMRDAEAPASARVSASKTVLEMAIKGVELEDLEARVGRLEEAIRENHVSGQLKAH